MPGIGGLSIANNLLANEASLNLNKNQLSLSTVVQQLSSGLRINSAADDPSGLAIAESLQSQVNGFDQGAQNVQDATNAAQIADGALGTTTDILQRIRTLAVEGASDLTSVDDRSNLQTEVQQLLLEVNRISQDTTYNGQNLLDGSHAGFQQQVDAFATITANSDLADGGTLVSAPAASSSGCSLSRRTRTAPRCIAIAAHASSGVAVAGSSGAERAAPLRTNQVSTRFRTRSTTDSSSSRVGGGAG